MPAGNQGFLEVSVSALKSQIRETNIWLKINVYVIITRYFLHIYLILGYCEVMLESSVIVIINSSRSPEIAYQLIRFAHGNPYVFVDDDQEFLAQLSEMYWRLSSLSRKLFVFFSGKAHSVDNQNKKLIELIDLNCSLIYYSGEKPWWLADFDEKKIKMLGTIDEFQTTKEYTPINSATRVGILLIQFDAAALTRDCISSLLKTSYLNKRIYLLDNSSSDYSSLEIFLEFSEVIVISSISRTSYCQGFNLLADFAIRDGCSYVFIANNDTRGFSKNLFETLIEALKDEIKIVSPKVLDYTKKEIHWRPRYKFGISFDIATEAYLLTTQTWSELGGFNSSYIMYVEDIDLLQRLRIKGGSAKLVDSVLMEHLGSGATRKMIFLPTFFYLRNLIWIQKERSDKSFKKLFYHFSNEAIKMQKRSEPIHRPIVLFYSVLALVVGLVTNSTTFKQKSFSDTLRSHRTELKYKIK